MCAKRKIAIASADKPTGNDKGKSELGTKHERCICKGKDAV